MTGITREQDKKLSQYNGALIHNYRPDIKKDADGNPILNDDGSFVLNSPNAILQISDTRDVEMEKLKNIKDMWQRFNDFTLDAAPLHVQNNAALGVLSEDERAKLLAFINAVKSEYAARKAKILASTSCDDITNIAIAEMPESILVSKDALIV